MLKVQRYSSIASPGDGLGTSRQVIPFASPSAPSVRQKVAQCVATCIPVVHIFAPLIRQPSTPSRASRTARVSMCVASLPWSGSVRPKAVRRLPSKPPRMNSCFCASLIANCSNISTKGKLPTMLCSFWRSLWRPSPFAAKCSRITAIHRLLPSLPPYFFGAEKRQWPAASAFRAACLSSASHSRRGRPWLSQSVRACPRRWSKKRILSSARSSGRISASMKASSSSR